ncbi:hypothetical protein D3C76_1390570 [compost metagenome]
MIRMIPFKTECLFQRTGQNNPLRSLNKSVMCHRKRTDHIDHHMDLRIRQPVVIPLYDLDHVSPTLLL